MARPDTAADGDDWMLRISRRIRRQARYKRLTCRATTQQRRWHPRVRSSSSRRYAVTYATLLLGDSLLGLGCSGLSRGKRGTLRCVSDHGAAQRETQRRQRPGSETRDIEPTLTCPRVCAELTLALGLAAAAVFFAAGLVALAAVDDLVLGVAAWEQQGRRAKCQYGCLLVDGDGVDGSRAPFILFSRSPS